MDINYRNYNQASEYLPGIAESFHCVLDDDAPSKEKGCQMMLSLATIDMVPAGQAYETMVDIVTKLDCERLVNEFTKLFNELLVKQCFTLDFTFPFLYNVLLSLEKHHDLKVDNDEYKLIPKYNAIAFLDYMNSCFIHLSKTKPLNVHPVKQMLPMDRNNKLPYLFKSIFAIMNVCDINIFKSLLTLIQIVIEVSDVSSRFQGVYPIFLQSFRTLKERIKILFAQMMENSPIKNQILEYIIKDFANKKYAGSEEKLFKAENGFDKLSKFFYNCHPNTSSSSSEYPLDLFVVYMSQLVYSYIHTKEYNEDAQAWVTYLKDYNGFLEVMENYYHDSKVTSDKRFPQAILNQLLTTITMKSFSFKSKSAST